MITPSSCKIADYNNHVPKVVPTFQMAQWLNETHSNHCYIYDIHFIDDNRERLKKLWGKPHFYFHGSNFFHGWRFVVLCGHRTEYFFVLTAKDKGTCIERTGHFHYDQPLSPIDQEFALWYEKELLKYQQELLK